MSLIQKSGVVVLLLLIFSQCNNKNSKLHNFKETSVLSFGVDSVSSNISRNIQLYRDKSSGIDFLAILNQNVNSLDFYSLRTNKLDRRIKMDKVGPNGVGKIDGFFIHNMDSLYVLYRYGYTLSLINSDSRLLDKYSLINTALDSTTFMPKETGTALPVASTYSPMVKVDNEIILTGFPDMDAFLPSFSESKELLLKYNFNNNELGYGSLSYPAKYKGAIWDLLHLRFYIHFNRGKKTILVSFPADEFIYEANLDGEILRKFSARSLNIEDVSPYLEKSKDFRTRALHYLTEPEYSGIIHDKYRKLFYRLAAVPVNEEDIDWSYLPGNLKSHYVIILDEQLNYKGEFFLPKGRYNPSMSFITKDGFYVALSDSPEDSIEFALIEPELK